ncbi:MAG: hypothetical protein FWG34_11385 [Oscillospiraceae bacterium]|nr:hypothetical protein [Oscillospiraceae bacterium]
MKIKFIAEVLILCLLFLAVSSCAQNESAKIAETAEETAAQDAGSSEIDPNQEAEAPRVVSEAPAIDCGGYNFRILSREAETADHHWEAKEIVAEEQTGDVVNDAVYTRNTTVSEKYNIQISRVANVDPAALAKKAVTAGIDEYDLMFAGLGSTVTIAQNGCLMDLKQVPHVDLAKPWYDQNANAQLSIANKLYTTFCDFTIMDKDATWVYLFNKKLVQDLGLDDPYPMVREGKWTIDKMVEMCKGASKDLNGDGTMSWEDQFGWEGESWNMYAGIIAAGIWPITKNSEDLPEYAGIGEKGIIAFTKLLDLFGDKSLCLRSDDVAGLSGNVWNDIMDASFMDGRILFTNAGMNRVTLFRSMDIDFGIIPSPKLEESRSEYCNTISPFQATSLSVPATVSEPEKIGAITDALCAESKYTLIPAYYDIQLKTKLARDDESAEMLDIIFANRRFDLELIYNWGGLSGIFATAMTKNDANITSSLEKAEPKIIKAIEKTVEAYASN